MYTFRFEALLEHRKHEEDSFHKDLALARKKLIAETNKLEEYRKHSSAYAEKLAEKFQQGHTAPDILFFQRYLDRLTGDIKKQEKTVHLAEQEFEQKRQELLEAVKKRKVLEKLRHREMDAYKRKEFSKEQAATNEAAADRHWRNR